MRIFTALVLAPAYAAAVPAPLPPFKIAPVRAFPSRLQCCTPLIPVAGVCQGVFMPACNVGHPDHGCKHGLGPGCAAAAFNETAQWLRIGGRGVDTAFGYENQPQVGSAIRAAIADGTVANRSAIFLTTKINPAKSGGCTVASALAAVKVDMQQLGIGPLDLVLLHFPCSTDAGTCAAAAPSMI